MQAMTDSRNERASSRAMAAVMQLSAESTSLVQYHSHGKVAVIGGGVAQEFAHRLTGNLSAQVILTDGAEEPGVQTIPVGNRDIRITGYLGNFRIVLGVEGRANYEEVAADIILDLSDSPLLSMPLKPPGYFTCVSEEPDLTRVEGELKELTGTFEKPKFFDFDPQICAHSRSGVTGCTRCIEACPADAITSIAESIEINPYLCQGGGVCASVCPTGAVRYVYPNVIDSLQTIGTLLNSYHEAEGSNPVIAFIPATDTSVLENRPANLLPVVVEELASVGMEIWLTTLAYGANRVLLIDDGSLAASVSGFVNSQLETAGTILRGLGYDSNSICLADHQSLHQQCRIENNPGLHQFANYAGSLEKRRTVLQAIDHLYQQSTSAEDIIALPDQSPFGRIHIDANSCTLCMSCTSVCPSRAISAGNDRPAIEFHEINCVQCGICASACPERAITLEPRLIADAEQRRGMTVLHEDTPFCCINCGKPFATQSLIDTMTQKLAGHYMFKSERARRRLLMCEDCRVADVVQDEDAMHTV